MLHFSGEIPDKQMGKLMDLELTATQSTNTHVLEAQPLLLFTPL